MSIRIDYAPMNNASTTAGSVGNRTSEYIVPLKVLDAKLAYPVIVRCRDCKHLISYPDASYCNRTSAFFVVSDEDFCAWAERRDA